MTPRYDGPAILRIEGTSEDVSVPLLRQRRRLGELLSGLDDDQWAAPSRCEDWSVRDVVTHLVGTDQFWFLSARVMRCVLRDQGLIARSARTPWNYSSRGAVSTGSLPLTA